MKIKELVKIGIHDLNKNRIEESKIKVNQILQYIFKKDKSYFVIHDSDKVDKLKELEYKKYIEELIQGKPLQYITHRQEFMGLSFYVDENVLIPQPDTETLVEEVLHIVKEKSTKGEEKREEETELKVPSQKVIRILDLCTGSGAIAISLKKYLQKEDVFYQEKNDVNQRNDKVILEIFAIDISKEALKIATKNAKENNVKIKFILSDMFQELKQYKGQFDVIVSNPPYIESSTIKTLSKEVQNEPHLALDGGQDGLKFYKIIADEACEYLKEDGTILLEIGYNQRKSVTNLFRKKRKI